MANSVPSPGMSTTQRSLTTTIVSRIFSQIKSKFAKMTVTRRKEHSFLGMNPRYNSNGLATISMKDHVKDAISDSSGLKISQRSASTPPRHFLFDVVDHETFPSLSVPQAEKFHTAKLLKYIAMRARMDVLLLVCFL